MSKSHSAPSTRLWLMPTLVTLAIVAALIGAFFWGRSTAPTQADSGGGGTVQQDTEQTETVPQEVADQVIRRDSEDPLAVGDVDAPVVLVKFSDYQCPFCARWNAETFPELQQYVDAGDLRIEWRDINMYGEDSERAAKAAVAAGLQDRFVEYHEQLFPEGDILEDYSAEALTEIAAETGLDVDQFETDFNSEETADIVAENEQVGRSVGAQSTPTFIMNQTPIVGAQPTEIFVDAFETELAAAEE